MLFLLKKITHSPESFDGRIKTISFQIASGILFDRNNKDHEQQANALKIPYIDYVVWQFYDFQNNPGIEMIDMVARPWYVQLPKTIKTLLY